MFCRLLSLACSIWYIIEVRAIALLSKATPGAGELTPDMCELHIVSAGSTSPVPCVTAATMEEAVKKGVVNRDDVIEIFRFMSKFMNDEKQGEATARMSQIIDDLAQRGYHCLHVRSPMCLAVVHIAAFVF